MDPGPTREDGPTAKQAQDTEILQVIIQKVTFGDQVWWHTSISQEAEAEESQFLKLQFY